MIDPPYVHVSCNQLLKRCQSNQNNVFNMRVSVLFILTCFLVSPIWTKFSNGTLSNAQCPLICPKTCPKSESDDEGRAKSRKKRTIYLPNATFLSLQSRLVVPQSPVGLYLIWIRVRFVVRSLFTEQTAWVPSGLFFLEWSRLTFLWATNPPKHPTQDFLFRFQVLVFTAVLTILNPSLGEEITVKRVHSRHRRFIAPGALWDLMAGTEILLPAAEIRFDFYIRYELDYLFGGTTALAAAIAGNNAAAQAAQAAEQAVEAAAGKKKRRWPFWDG